jgi:hypothetical protein
LVFLLQAKIEEMLSIVSVNHAKLPLQERILLLKRLFSPFPSLAMVIQYFTTNMLFMDAVSMQDEEQWIKSKSQLVPLFRVIDEALAVPIENVRNNYYTVCIHPSPLFLYNTRNCYYNKDPLSPPSLYRVSSTNGKS